jgi:hypothetical protein
MSAIEMLIKKIMQMCHIIQSFVPATALAIVVGP